VLSGVTSPLLAVSDVAVDLTPRPVKEWAVSTFGSADKAVLLGGVVVVLASLLAGIGVRGVRRPGSAVLGMVLLNLVGTAAAVADRTAEASSVSRLVAPAAGLVVSVSALVLLMRALRATGRGPLPGRVVGDELPESFDRRRFLVTALAVGAVAAAGGVVSRTWMGGAGRSRALVRVPRPEVPAPPVPGGASFDVAGLAPYLTSNRDFYRVDTALVVPEVPAGAWRLRIHGMVDQPLELTYEDLLSRRLVERRVTLTCVSNPLGGDLLGNATWIGVPVADLLAEAGVREGADAVRSTSADDMTIGTPLSALTDGRDALLAVAMGGEPLPLEHGFPVRMVVPGLYGYVSATKWLADLEVTRFADFTAYWTDRGYAAQAPIKTSSRIDVPRAFAHLNAGPTVVAGLAWAQDRGIDAVEVRVDGGQWQQAELAVEDSADTWRQWRWRWDATPGNHRLQVRATDRTGYTQTSRREPVAPDGATGWHTITVSVR
jgi:DMSO/TMAO reductase YedYZ molybdopterin-dependent catalytic subunit